MNFKIYILTIVVSILLMLPACIWDYNILTMLSGIGCSGFAAAIMAIFIEYSTRKRELEKNQNARNQYFKDIYNQLTAMLERILWFYERIEDESFCWGYNAWEYYTKDFMLEVVNKHYNNNQEISFDDALKRLEEIANNCSDDGFAKMSEETKNKVEKMFLILSVGSSSLVSETNNIKENQLMLNFDNYLSMRDVKNLLNSISWAISQMEKPCKNYKEAILRLVNATKQIRSVGNYTNDIYIGLHGNFKINEINKSVYFWI